MSISTLESDFRDKVSAKVRLVLEGNERYRVFTPFLFDDGDHLSIVLKKEGARWVLSDEAHTYMHLTYDIDYQDLTRGPRSEIISNALSRFQIEDRNGELVLEVLDEQYGDALYSFVQALLKVIDVSYLSRERVRSTFDDDFKALISEAVPEEHRTFDWHDPDRDPKGVYTVDCRVNGMQRPLFVHALSSDTRTRDATILLHQFENWGVSFRSLAIFEDQETITRKVLARFSDVGEKQYSRLSANQDRIKQFLLESITV